MLEEQAQRVAAAGESLLPPVLAADREVDLSLRQLQADLGLRSGPGALQRAEIRSRAQRACLQVRCAVGDRRRPLEWRQSRTASPPGVTADHALQSPSLRADLELGAAHGLLRLQRGDPTAEQLHLRDLAAAHACLIQRHDLLQARGVLASQRQILLCELHVDERLLDLQLQRADGIEDLGLGHRTLLLRHRHAPRALRAALQEKIDAHAVLGRARAVLLIEARAQEVEVIAAQAQHRIGTEPRRDQVRIGDRDPSTRGDQVEVLLERFRDGGVEREPCGGGGLRRCLGDNGRG